MPAWCQLLNHAARLHLLREAARTRRQFSIWIRQTVSGCPSPPPRGPHFEPMEPRLLMSAVSWDGGGDGVQWRDPLN